MIPRRTAFSMAASKRSSFASTCRRQAAAWAERRRPHEGASRGRGWRAFRSTGSRARAHHGRKPEATRFPRARALPARACSLRRLRTTVIFFAVEPSPRPSGSGRRPRRPTQKDAAPSALTFWPRLTKHYVAAVLAAASLGFTYWYVSTASFTRAIEVVTAILTVTCPCAFGIATPLAYELVYARLRRLGLLVHQRGFLDRATTVRRVVFDKTGTLTTGVLKLVDDGALDGLEQAQRRILYNIVVRSAHPKSIAIKRALDALATDQATYFDESLVVSEQPGKGLTLVAGGRTYRLGEPGWASATGIGGQQDVVFSVDGRICASFATVEALRPDARAEVHALQAAGYDVWILSGDASERVHALAEMVGIPENRTLAECSPEQKAAWIRRHDEQDTLMMGDGLNDGLAVTDAHCSGTPAIDRPFIAARSDFYLVTSGLAPVRQALEASRLLRRVVQRNLAVALAYNTVAVALAIAGLMSPLVCAILMPLSSLSVILSTTASLSTASRTKEPLNGNHPAASLREPDARRGSHSPVRLQC